MQQNKYYVLRTGIHSSIHNVWSQLQRWRAHLRTTYFVSRKIRYRSYYTGGYYADMLRTKIILSIRLPYVENWEHNSDLYVLLLSILYYVQHWPYSIGTTYVPIVLVPLIQLPYYGTPYYCTYITARVEGG